MTFIISLKMADKNLIIFIGAALVSLCIAGEYGIDVFEFFFCRVGIPLDVFEFVLNLNICVHWYY